MAFEWDDETVVCLSCEHWDSFHYGCEWNEDEWEGGFPCEGGRRREDADEEIKPLSYAPVSAVPVAGFVEIRRDEPIGNFLRFPNGWYYQEDGRPMEFICSAQGRPYPGCFARRDGRWYYRRDDSEPWEYVGVC